MKKCKNHRYVIIITLVLILFVGYYQTPIEAKDPYFLNVAKDFRIVNWGASMKQVLQKEPMKLIKKTNNQKLIFKTNISNTKYAVIYSFNEYNELKDGEYLNIQNYNEPSDYVVDFYRITDFIKNKFGKPTQIKKIWEHEKYKTDNTSEYSELIVNGK